MLTQSSVTIPPPQDPMMETARLRKQAQQWWQIVRPVADRCFELVHSCRDYTGTHERRLAFLYDLYNSIEEVAALPCPIPLTTARRQLLDALDAVVAGFDCHACGDCEAASGCNRAAIRHLSALEKTLESFGVQA